MEQAYNIMAMQTRRMYYAPLLALLLTLLALIAPHAAYAEDSSRAPAYQQLAFVGPPGGLGNPNGGGGDGDPANAGGSEMKFCPKNGLFTARVVSCVKTSLMAATTKFLAQFSGFAQPIIYSMATLAVIFFGLDLLQGERKLAPKGIVLVIKISMVLYFTNNFGGFLPDVYETMESLQGVVTTALEQPSANCPDNSAAASPDGKPQASMVVWNRMDCLVGRVFGFGPTAILSSGVVALLGAALFSGTAAVHMFFAGLGGVFMVILMIFRAVHTFIMSYAVLAFLVVISPLIIPLVLFRATTRIFEAWVDQMVTVMLQPLILFGFLSFFFVVFEQSLFVGDNSLQNLLGTDYIDKVKSNVPMFSWPMTASKEGYDVIGKGFVSSMSDTVFALGNKILNIGDFISPSKLDFGAEHVKKMQGLGINMISIVILNYMMMNVAESVPSIASRMTGRSGIDVRGGDESVLESRTKRGLDKLETASDEMIRRRNESSKRYEQKRD